MKKNDILKHEQADYVFLEDDGRFPNNPRLPLLVYHAVSNAPEAAEIESLFRRNGWVSSWRNGIYSYHHYHSTAHEVLGVYGGSASVQFGGEQGVVFELQRGGVVVIPAGVAHACLRSTADLAVVGAYPTGQEWDLCDGSAGERPGTDRNIRRLPDPRLDPVYGTGGPLFDLWLGKKPDSAG
jgi:uncharacterized protein YjlB